MAPRERSITGWVFVGLGLALVAGCGWVYQFRQQWVARVADVGGISLTGTPRQDESSFIPLYQRYGMAPLGAGVTDAPKLNTALAGLLREPCDKRAVFQASLELENLRATRGAAEILKGFADTCPEASGERYRASELYYLLGDYDTAVKLSSDLIDRQPGSQKPYFVRAKSQPGLERYAAAIEDYATLIRLLPDTKSIVPEVFTRMSESYEKLDRPCEAIGPIQTYIALDSEHRSTTPLLKRIAALAAKGNCAQVYAKGVARIPRRSTLEE